MKQRINAGLSTQHSTQFLLCAVCCITLFSMRSVAQDSSNASIYSGPTVQKMNELPDSIFSILSASGAKSEYFSGLKRRSEVTATLPARVKIMRITGRNVQNGDFANPNPQATVRLSAIVLDNLGNFLTSLHNDSAHQFSLVAECVKVKNQTSPTPQALSALGIQSIREQSLYNSSDLSIALCADKAGYMQRFGAQTEVAYQAFFSAFGEKVEKIRVNYDHRIATDSLAMKGTTAPNLGLTALYKASYKAASLLKYSERKHKALVILSGGADDASIVYTLRDVLEVVRASGITVYAIAFGSGADTYALRTMAHSSGGRFYAVDEFSSSNITRELIAVLQEIANSYKVFYEITPSVDAAPHQDSSSDFCAESDVALTVASTSQYTLPQKIREAAPYLAAQEAYFPKHQIIATFPPLSATIQDDYEGLISTLGETLKDNPTKVIELIGHTDQTGNDENNRNFALKRAQAVKRYLLLMGVNPAQIRLRSVGREKPIFYFEKEDWKSRANRRVELRWLDPSLVPYEIVAQAVSTEEDAMRLEAEWNARGYEAYYEPFLINRIPVYRLKLWGFPTPESAEKVKRELQEKYKLRLTVQ
ncbi:MAG: VWA domain-containing protein [Candidatus Kapaibacterium sp.]|nr:MAG: VWA domain-containing protein [Candidatus Kapabacteria bacterium]